MTDTNQEAEVYVGDEVVTVKRKGSSAVSCASILGTEVVDNVQCIYLDRIVHGPGESTLGQYAVKGAVSSILTKSL